MAGFTDVVKIINRMPEELAEAMRGKLCTEPESVEKEVLSWAKDNPEPRYPTWAEWLCEVGVSRVSSYQYGKVIYIRTRKFYEEMDAETAKLLGVEPKAQHKPEVK